MFSKSPCGVPAFPRRCGRVKQEGDDNQLGVRLTVEQKINRDIALNGERNAPRESGKLGNPCRRSKQVKQVADIAKIDVAELHNCGLEFLSENEMRGLSAPAGAIVRTRICEVNGGLIDGDGNLKVIRILRPAEKEQITSLADEPGRRSAIAIPLTNIFHGHYVVAKNTNL